jgi:two-component system, cell cycle sensor histidine kinase PleC
MSKTTPEQSSIERHNFQLVEWWMPFNMRKWFAPKQKVTDANDSAFQGELLELFLRNQMSLAPLLPMLALMLGLLAMSWMPAQIVMSWVAGALACHFIQNSLFGRYFIKERDQIEQSQWVGMISISELLQGVVWILPLYLFWDNADSMQRTFLLAAMMAVTAVRLLTLTNFTPLLATGTGVISIGVAVRCIAEGQPIYYAMAGLIVLLEVFFLLVSRKLQQTAKERLIFRAQKDELIDQLRAEKERAELERRKAENANKAKSAFLANMSHELRTERHSRLFRSFGVRALWPNQQQDLQGLRRRHQYVWPLFVDPHQRYS